jgi:chromosome segregation ATPase
VLRKSTAKAIEEKEIHLDAALQAGRKIEQRLLEIDALQKELNRLGVESILVQQNKELFNEINAVRYKEAQTHQINETLVRLHAKEAQKARDLEARTSELTLEKEKATEQLSFARREAQMSSTQVEQLAAQLQALQQVNNSFDEVQTERTFLRERLLQAEAELQQKGQRVEHLEATLQELHNQLNSTSSLSKTEAASLAAEKVHLLEQINELRSHLSQHAHSDALYRQLKGQFEERNQVLHETRKQLFYSDTQLQTLKQELEQKNLETDPIPTPLRLELNTLEEENQHLAEENLLLQDLVTHLIDPTNILTALPLSAPVVKKKGEEEAPA